MKGPGKVALWGAGIHGMVGDSGVMTAQRLRASMCVVLTSKKHFYVSLDDAASYAWVQCQQTGHSRMEQDDECMGQCAWLFCCWWCHFLTGFGVASFPPSCPLVTVSQVCICPVAAPHAQ